MTRSELRTRASLLRGIMREATSEAISRPAWSLLIIAMIAGMCVATLLTSGRTEAATAAALAQIDAEGTRAITVRAAADAGLDATVLDRVRRIADVESAVAFGPISDSRNALVEGSALVPLRRVYGGFVQTVPGGGALASRRGAEALGLRDGTGPIVTEDGNEVVVGGTLEVPDYLRELEPLVVVPAEGSRSDPVTLLVVVADEPRRVSAVSEAVTGLLELTDPSKASIETSAQLAGVRAAVGGALESRGRATVLGIVGVAGALVAASLLGLVELRRKDFGRRRALGAPRSLIMALLLFQVAELGAIGAILGTGLTWTSFALTGAPLPAPEFVLAVAVASLVTSVVAALLPAALASRRDPLYELRVP